MMITADGYIAGPNNELDWVVWEEEMDRDAAKLINSVDTMLVGYGAYKDMASYWPAALTKPQSESEGTFAKLINEKPKVIVSQSEEELLWKNDTLLFITDLKQQITELKESKSDIVFYGGVGLAQSLVREDLIDTYRLLISPVAIGKGKPLFSELLEPRKLKAIGAKIYESGAMLLTYSAQ